MKVSLHKRANNRTGCLICGKPLIYSDGVTQHSCATCGGSFSANAVCEGGHFICDACHVASSRDFVSILRRSTEKNPMRLFDEITALDGVHMHGPEHHSIVPCVLLTAYRNNGGDLDINVALDTAIKHGSQVPGGACANWGACGAAVGAGIYASIVMGSSPINAKVWGVPQELVARCLDANAELGGPRCCKRSSRNAIVQAVRFTSEWFGIEMPIKQSACTFPGMNKECLHARCPYYGGGENV